MCPIETHFGNMGEAAITGRISRSKNALSASVLMWW